MTICRYALLGAMVLALVFPAFARKPKVLLSLDYTQRTDWAYTLDYNAERVVDEAGKASRKKTRIHCDLDGEYTMADEGQRLIFKISGVELESDIYAPQERVSIASKLQGADFSTAVIYGCPVIDTLRTFAVSEISQWDLVIQFAKLLPDIPKQPVSKGYSWEASGVYPIRTSVGEVPCDVYRLYKVDSVAADTSKVYFSWQFRYAAAQKAVEELDILQRVPVSGKGKGTAVIDVRGKVLLEANVQFETPTASTGAKKVSWIENTTLKYVPSKPGAK